MNILARATAPAFAAGSQLQLDNAFRAEEHGDFAVEALRSIGHEYAAALLQGCRHFRLAHDLREVRRANLFLAFRDEHEVYGKFLAGAANGVERREQRGFWPFLIYRAASHNDLSKAGPIDEGRFERR